MKSHLPSNLRDAAEPAPRGMIGTHVRRANIGALMSLMRDGEPRTSPQIGHALSLRPPTVLRLLEKLRGAGVVDETGVCAEGSIGRPPKLWRLNARAGYVVGVSLARYSRRAVVTDLTGRPVARLRQDASPDLAPSDLPAVVREVVDAVSSSQTSERLLGVGLALPGIVDTEAGRILASGMLSRSTSLVVDYPAQQCIEASTGLPVTVVNDANAGALAVFRDTVRAGDLEPDDSVVYFLRADNAEEPGWHGMGMVLCGDLYYGTHSAAGEGVGVAAFHTRARGLVPDGSDLAHAYESDEIEQLRSSMTVCTAIAAWMAPKRVVFGGDLSVPEERAGDVVGQVNGALAEYYTRFGGYLKPRVLLDPLWPDTVELGAAHMALDRLFAASRETEPALLSALALIGA